MTACRPGAFARVDEPTAKEYSPLRESSCHTRSASSETYAELAQLLFAAVECREHPRALGRDRERVLEVRGPAAVRGHDGPLVLEQVGLLGAHRDHRLDREREARHQARTPARPTVVGHVGRLVHLRADAMTGVVLHDAEAA